MGKETQSFEESLAKLEALVGQMESGNMGLEEMVKAFEKASGQKVPYRIAPRRPGDVAAVYADPSKAERLLGWKATRTLEDMCRDGWNWQSHNPNGYEG